jgi:hypothetical protein
MGKYRISFVAGFATGFVLGARAGRERYDQIVKAARTVAEHPAVQQAAGAVQAQASGLASAAGTRISSEVRARAPQVASAARAATAKVSEKVPGLPGRSGDGDEDPAGDSDPEGHRASGRRTGGNGHRPASGSSFTTLSHRDGNPGH